MVLFLQCFILARAGLSNVKMTGVHRSWCDYTLTYMNMAFVCQQHNFISFVVLFLLSLSLGEH